MGLFNKRKSGEYAGNGDHHPTRDGVLTGAVAHHESNQHPNRNALLAGGAVGEVQHHRNERAEHVGTGSMSTHTNATHGYGTGTNTHTTSTAAPLGTGAPVAATEANTGPAPLHGIHANGNANGTAKGAPGLPPKNGITTAAAPAIRQANNLERKSKMESTFGGLLCSRSMKAKAHTHAAQADHLRMQASELGEAERLENEAGMRRQRAVGLGADPVHASGTTGYATAAA